MAIKNPNLSSALLKGSLTLLLLFGVFNVCNYLYHLTMARFLGPSEYGVLAVLMSLVYILTIPGEAVQTMVAYYASEFSAHKRNGEIKYLLLHSIKKGTLFATFLFSLFLLISLLLSTLLNIPFVFLAITGLVLYIVFISPVLRGVLQGRKQFLAMGSNIALEAASKLFIALLLVALGFGLGGAVFALILAGIIAIFAGFLPLSDILKQKPVSFKVNNIYRQSWPILVSTFAWLLMYSSDIILARLFFSPVEAGTYAFVSLLGKSILFIGASISKTLLPLSVEAYESGKGSFALFKKAVYLIALLSLLILVPSLIFSDLIVVLLSFGSTLYESAAPLLAIIVLGSSFLAFVHAVIIYKISVRQTARLSLLLVFPLIQIYLFALFHASLFAFSLVYLATNFLMLIYSLSLVRHESYNSHSSA